MKQAPLWQATIFTLFPEIFPGALAHSVTGRALAQGIWSLKTVQIRDFATDAYKSVDDTVFGGGAGMVMRPNILDDALNAETDLDKGPLICLSPRGEPLRQKMIQNWVSFPKIHLICGRYEGIDERLLQKRKPIEVSLGDFVLSGGELAALPLIDACVRLLPGVLGEKDSLSEESFEENLLEYPHYTKPRIWQGMSVPDVLTSGNHEAIRGWKKKESERLTRERRPDLWARYIRSKKGK